MQDYTKAPTAIVILGATGNLAETKLLPALFDLYLQKKLPGTFRIIGLSRKNLTSETYRQFVQSCVAFRHSHYTPHALTDFCNHLYYLSGDFDDEDAYAHIKEALISFDTEYALCSHKLFYLAVPPSLYSTIFNFLKMSNMMSLCDGSDSWSRILVEKPFGNDLITAEMLEKQLCDNFSEDQIYRIDHYLAKDAIENILSLRFANSILSDSWNGTKIEHISIRLFESQDVSTRGAFYDQIGALRDVGQNHILQILALLTMNATDLHDTDAIRKNRLDAIRSLTTHETDLRIRGQYIGYRETPGVNPESSTETYFKIETRIDSDIWNDVKVTLESGKALHESCTEAVITFRPTETCVCGAESSAHAHRNTLRIMFSPQQSIQLTMWVKEPGFSYKLHKRTLVLAEEKTDIFRSPEAYERVLYDCIIGDQTRFVSGAEISASWKFIMPILNSFAFTPLHTYQKGTAGPSPDICTE
ncbi:MAG TPA: glucose-6-phosphate dehydrogenase [Candidatus Paceibacterota bacterium]|nr:glucose-6-phosphate dehydrogenase [Candidatus Paceibacterota bacterium]